jgi:hypothetical protein
MDSRYSIEKVLFLTFSFNFFMEKTFHISSEVKIMKTKIDCVEFCVLQARLNFSILSNITVEYVDKKMIIGDLYHLYFKLIFSIIFL